MLKNVRTDEEETWGNTKMFLEKEAENNIDKTCEPWETFMENGNQIDIST